MQKSIYSDEYKKLLTLLRQIREEAGLTQEDLAVELGQTQSFVSKCERGERRIDVIELLKFCKAIGIDIVDFIERLKPYL